MIRTTSIALLAGLLFPATALAQSRPVPHDFREPELTPTEQARQYFDQGQRAKAKAETLEGKREAADASARAKLDKKVLKAWKKAEHEFELAVKTWPEMFQAHGELGWARFKTGDVEGGLAELDGVIDEASGYNRAIEYRAEVWLSLGRVDEAKQAYDTLAAREDETAVELLAAMKRWVEERRAAGGPEDAAVADDLERWIAER
jgi:hypothetical protein